MSRRGVALNTSLIKINNMSSYYNSNQINFYNPLDVSGNVNIGKNLNILGTDDVFNNTNVTGNTTTYILDKLTNTNNKLITTEPVELVDLSFYIGNTYIFDQTISQDSNPDELIIISKKSLEYNRANGSRIRVPYTTNVFYCNKGSTTYYLASTGDDTNRTKLKFIPTERGVYYLVSKIHNKTIKNVTITVYDNVYKYSSFVTQSGLGLAKNLNVGGNMNVNNGMLYVVNDVDYYQTKSVGVGTTKPKYGFDLTNLPNYNDAVILPKTIGLGTTLGYPAMIRFNNELKRVEGYIVDEWLGLGKLEDKDRDTFARASIPNRPNELDFTSNGHIRLTIKDDDFTLIGIGTILPKSTLHVEGNLNIKPDNTTSGINFGYDTLNTDNYFNANLKNTTEDTSFHFISKGLTYTIPTNIIKTNNDRTLELNDFNQNINGICDETFNSDNTTINSNTNITISKLYFKNIENSSVETYALDNISRIHGISTESYQHNSNTNIDGNFHMNLNNTYELHILDNNIETFNKKKNITIANNLIETIIGLKKITITDIVNETYGFEHLTDIYFNKTTTIENNMTSLFNTTYNINVKGNISETVLNNKFTNISLNKNIDLHGSYNKFINNDEIFLYNHNLDLNHKQNVSQYITINKNNNINVDLTETYNQDNIHYNKNKNTTIYGTYQYNLNKDYTLTNKNKTINVFNNLNNIYNKNVLVELTGTTDNNVTYINNYDNSHIHNVDKVNNIIIYNKFTRSVYDNSTEDYKKSVYNNLLLVGHPLSGPNTISYEIDDLFLTNYVKIVNADLYNITIQQYPRFYTFPGDGDDLLNNSNHRINDWFIFKKGSTEGTFIVINAYFASTHTGEAGGAENYILGPDDFGNYSIVEKSKYDPNFNYINNTKIIIGPRKHALEYNLTTYYIKIFSIGSSNDINANESVTLLKLNNTTVIAIQDHPSISQVGTENYRFNNIDTTPTSYSNTNENSRFIFVYINNTKEYTNNIVTKANYYIYSKDEGNDKLNFGYIKNNDDGTIGIEETTNLTNKFVWTLEAVSKNDNDLNSDVYHIYNTDNGINHYITLDLNRTSITLGGLNNDIPQQKLTQQFTLYYFNKNHKTVTSSTLVYNNEGRTEYLTKEYKKIYVNGNTSDYISSELSSNKNKVGQGNIGLFLMLYGDNFTIPGSAIETGTFKIYCTDTDKYLFDDPNQLWVIESVYESNSDHTKAKHVIKTYNNGNPTQWLHSNLGVLELINITGQIPDTAMFLFDNIKNINEPGKFNKNISQDVVQTIISNKTLAISGNTTETYKSHFNINIGDQHSSIKHLFNINVYKNDHESFAKNNTITINNNIQESIFKSYKNHIEKNVFVRYNVNNTSIISGNLTQDITGYTTQHIYGTNYNYIKGNTDETYSKDFTIKSSHNKKTIGGNLVETITETQDIIVDKSSYVEYNGNNKISIISNLNKVIGLDKNINITQNSNITISGNKNITIALDLVSTTKGNTVITRNKFNTVTIDKDNTIDYHENKNITIKNNVKEIISGDRTLFLSGNNNEIYNSDKRITIDNNLKETINGIMNLNISGDTTFFDASDFNISCNKNINFTSNGYVHITNTNNGQEGQEEIRALVINGGFNSKSVTHIMGDIKIAGNLNSGLDLSDFQTEDFEVNDPLITLGIIQTANTDSKGNTYSGILNQCFVNSEQKFTGIVRSNLNTYAILNNINVDTNDNTEFDKNDLDNTFEKVPVAKHANFTINKVVSILPNINAHGDMFIAKNIFIGIVDTPLDDSNNSFTLNIGSNINTLKNTFSITSNKDIQYNITNQQNINITSTKDYNISALNNKSTHIHNNLLETLIGTYDSTTKDANRITYKKNYNVNTTGDLNSSIIMNKTTTIKNDYNINHFNFQNLTIKHDYNLNTFKNTTIKYNSNLDSYINNSTNILYNDNRNYTNNNHILNIHSNFKCNVSGTYDKYIKLDNTEDYHNKTLNIHGDLTETITGLNEKTINGSYDLTLSGDNTETYGNDRTITISGNLVEYITGYNSETIYHNLHKTVKNENTETLVKSNTITISNNLNSVIHGNYNITIDKNIGNEHKKNYTINIKDNVNETYKFTYNTSVYNNSFNTKYGLEDHIEGNSNIIIKDSYFRDIHGNIISVLSNDKSYTFNKYKTLNIHNNSLETYGNTYKIHHNSNSDETYNHNKKINIKNNHRFDNNGYYSHHTIGISTSTFHSSYNINLKGHLVETLYSNYDEYVKQDYTTYTDVDYTTTVKLDKKMSIELNNNITNKGTKDFTVTLDYENVIKKTNNQDIYGDYKNETKSINYKFIKEDDTISHNNSYSNIIENNLTETIHGTYLITNHTGVSNTDVKNTIDFNSNVTSKIGVNYTKNIYNNNDRFIKVLYNKSVINNTFETYKNDVYLQNHSSILRNINKKYDVTVYETFDKSYSNNNSFTISHNDALTVEGNVTSTLYNNSTETYKSSLDLYKGSDNNTTMDILYEDLYDRKVFDTQHNRIKSNSNETYSSLNNSTIGENLSRNIVGSYNINIMGDLNETLDKSSDITQLSNISVFNQLYSKYIEKDTIETVCDTFKIINNNNSRFVGSTYNLTSNHESKPNINLTTYGGLNITADANINKNNNINFTTRVGIKEIVSYIPQIINTTTIGTNNIKSTINTTNLSHYVINPKTVNIIYIDSFNDLTTLISNDDNIYIRLDLPDGSYNGQVIKIILHPIFEQTFNMTDRLSKGLKTNVVVRIDSFCDTNDNEYVKVDLLLNRGGMGLSLIYVDDDTNDTTDGYWMFMNNSYIYN